MTSHIAIKSPLGLIEQLGCGAQTLPANGGNTVQRYHNRAFDFYRAVARSAAVQPNARPFDQFSLPDVRDEKFRHIERLGHFDLRRWDHARHASSQTDLSPTPTRAGR